MWCYIATFEFWTEVLFFLGFQIWKRILRLMTGCELSVHAVSMYSIYMLVSLIVFTISRDQSILFFIFTSFSFWQFFFLAYYTQDFAQYFNILLKVNLCSWLLKAITSELIILHHCPRQFWRAASKLIISSKVTCNGNSLLKCYFKHYSDSECIWKTISLIYKHALQWFIDIINNQ